MYTLIYSKWITNKVLLYSTGNSAQCPVAAGMAGVWGRMDSCKYRTESLGYPPDTITTLLICCACICLSLFRRVWLCNPMDCSLPGSSAHGILQARILEWVARHSSGDLPKAGTEPTSLMSPALAGGFFLPLAPPGKPVNLLYSNIKLKVFFKSVHDT